MSPPLVKFYSSYSGRCKTSTDTFNIFLFFCYVVKLDAEFLYQEVMINCTNLMVVVKLYLLYVEIES